MERTTVHFPVEMKRRLAEAARQRGTSEAAVIREAVEHLLGQAPPRPTLPLFRSGAADADDVTPEPHRSGGAA